MEMKEVISGIDAEIALLQRVRELLQGTSVGNGIKRRNGPRKRRRLSDEARAKIAAAQKARWAKFRKAK